MRYLQQRYFQHPKIEQVNITLAMRLYRAEYAKASVVRLAEELVDSALQIGALIFDKSVPQHGELPQPRIVIRDDKTAEEEARAHRSEISRSEIAACCNGPFLTGVGVRNMNAATSDQAKIGEHYAVEWPNKNTLTLWENVADQLNRQNSKPYGYKFEKHESLQFFTVTLPYCMCDDEQFIDPNDWNLVRDCLLTKASALSFCVNKFTTRKGMAIEFDGRFSLLAEHVDKIGSMQGVFLSTPEGDDHSCLAEQCDLVNYLTDTRLMVMKSFESFCETTHTTTQRLLRVLRHE